MFDAEQLRNHTPYHQILAVCVCLTFITLPVGTAPFTLCSLAALGVWLLSGIAFRDRADWQGQEWLAPLLALILLPWLGMLWTSASFEESLKLAARSHYWLFAFVAVSVMKRECALRTVLMGFIGGTTIIAIIVFLYLRGWLPETVYLQKFLFKYYITFSLFLVISILLLAYFFKTSSRPYSWAIVALMLFLAAMITQLKGRSAYLSLALLSPWAFVTMSGCRRLPVIIAAASVALILMLSVGIVRERLALIPREIDMYRSGVSTSYLLPDGTLKPSSVGLRLTMWQDALKVFQRHPLIGAGTAGFQHEVKMIDAGRAFSHPHSSYLYVAASYGVLGITLYCWLLAVTLWRAWRTRDLLSGHAILVFVAVILIGSLTDTHILAAATGVALGFVVGIPTPGQSLCVS
ncbi:MAG: O-antigen ligase family protein [Geobacter sp.]|nr:O-antigen ligase family protein [Geobacter sp.]